MGEPGRSSKHSVIASNRAIRDIHQSLKHLQVSQGTKACQQHCFENQSQLSFERQLGLSSSSALSESVAGDRRSYPRVASSSKQAFALENIRRDLQFLPPNSSTNWHQNIPSENKPLHKSDFKSSSYTDLHQHYGSSHLERSMAGELKSIDQQKLSLILSYGYDEAIATEILSMYPNQSLEILIDKLNSTQGSRKLSRGSNHNNNMQRVTQTQRLFGVTQFAPRSQSVMNLSTNNRQPVNVASVPSRYQNFQTYEQPPSRPMESSNYQHTGPYIDLRSGTVINSDGSSSSDKSESASWKANAMSEVPGGTRNYDYKMRDAVTLRKKTDRHLRNQQDRWSAEVLHKTDNKRNSMEFTHKPPPPYPGFAKGSFSRISSQEGEFQTAKNTPITVIFDEINERVDVVGGIPEGFESSSPSSPSSGQSSPRATQKDPPPYEFIIPKNQQTVVFPSQSNMIIKSSLSPLQKPQPNQPNLSALEQTVQQTPLNHQVTPQNSFQAPSSAYAVPPTKNKSDTKFIPISDIQRSSGDHGYSSDRGSPPPYPGAPMRSSQSNRVSLNIDELESTVGSVNSYSGKSGYGSMSSSGAQESYVESGSSTSPVPDDVERSYSPLPICNSNTFDKTMIVHAKDKKETVKKQEPVCDEFSTRLKNYTPQAYKFYMEQHVENLLKFQEQRKIRRQQLEAEMRRVGLPAQAQEQMRKLLNKKESNYMRLRRAKMDKSMFTKIKVVGVGAFGEVSLVKKKGTSAYYAMKTLRKSEVLRRNQVAHVKAERDILAEADNEWVVKLFYSFQNEQNLYFVMDFIPGGDLMALLIKFGIFDDTLAKFYISELVLAIESVHKLGFIHRDIKPDNILIDKNGHIKLTDFGLCTGFRWTHDSKYYQPEPEGAGHSRQYSMEPEGGWESLLNDVNCNCKSHRIKYDLLKPLQRRKLRRHMRCQAHSLVGTPNYIAPEVLMRIPYGQQCDWWSVGVIMFEMIIGHPPFLAQSPAETQYKVINWRQILSIPKKRLSKDAEDLLLRLCTDPEERLGKDGADEIKEHPYFKGVKFQTLHQERAPYIPSICSATDTSNFDPVPEAMCESDSEESEELKNSNSTRDGPEYAFYEFTFRNFFDDGGLVNPNLDLEVHENESEMVNEPHKTASKRSATKSNTSITIPPKVSATGSSTSEEKTPIYV